LKEILIVMLSKDIRSRPDWLGLDAFVKKNNTSNNTFPTHEIEKRSQFIRRTVQNSLTNKSKINQNSTPTQNEPTFSKFYGQAPS